MVHDLYLVAFLSLLQLKLHPSRLEKSAARQLSFYRSQTYLSPPAADHGIWTLLKMDRTTSVQDVKVKTDLEKKTYVKVRVKTDFEKILL